MTGLGANNFTELFKPKPVGETVNSHVVFVPPEPAPDYAAMQRLIEGRDQPPLPETKSQTAK